MNNTSDGGNLRLGQQQQGVPPTKLPLATMRQRKLWSPNQLSEVSGVAVTTIAAIERGAKPRLGTIEKLSTALGCSPHDIEWPGVQLVQRETDREYMRTPFRLCLEHLANEHLRGGSYILDNGVDRRTPQQLLVGTDLETSWLQAPATLEIYFRGRYPEHDEVVGNLEVEFLSHVGTGPFGKEIGFRKERWVVRFVANQPGA